MADQAFYPREPSASNASKVVDITKLPLFLGDDETEPFDEERHLYDLEALAQFLCVRSFIGGIMLSRRTMRGTDSNDSCKTSGD